VGVDGRSVEAGVMSAGSGRPPTSRRVFLAGTGAAAGAAAVAGLFGGPLAETARAGSPGGSLPSYAPIPNSLVKPPWVLFHGIGRLAVLVTPRLP